MGKTFRVALIAVSFVAMASTTTFHSQSVAQAADGRKSVGREIKSAEEKLQKLVGTANRDEALVLATRLFEEYSEIAKKEPANHVARSFAGVFGAFRCRYASDTNKMSRYMNESIPLLDSSVDGALKGGQRKSLIAVLNNRASVYIGIPSLFKKEKEVLDDAKMLVELAKKEKLNSLQTARYNLLLARALNKNGDKTKAREVLDGVRKGPAGKNEEIRRSIDQIGAEVGP
jgi:hypothetical protein